MKRVDDIFSRIVTMENLHYAAYRVLRGKRGQIQAGNFFYDLEGSLLALKRDLIQGSYRTGEYRAFWISDPKPRLISAAPFRDRVVHHALIRVVEPIFERRFIYHSYACRLGKGNHRALKKFVEWGRKHHYVLKLDIQKFFPSIDHAILKDILRRTIKDKETLSLFDTIINGSNLQEPIVRWFPGDDLLSPIDRRRGIPIGNLTSQCFGNVFLDQIDHFIKERLRVGPYLRYVDDLALFGDDKKELTALRAEISRFLSKFRLSLNEGKSRVRQLKEGVEFLGFVCLPGRLRLSSRNVSMERRRIRKQRRAYSIGRQTWSEIAPSLQAWNAHASHGDTWRFRRDIYRMNTFVFHKGSST
jgi:retron-type reverse transcriptase